MRPAGTGRIHNGAREAQRQEPAADAGVPLILLARWRHHVMAVLGQVRGGDDADQPLYCRRAGGSKSGGARGGEMGSDRSDPRPVPLQDRVHCPLAALSPDRRYL